VNLKNFRRTTNIKTKVVLIEQGIKKITRKIRIYYMNSGILKIVKLLMRD